MSNVGARVKAHRARARVGAEKRAADRQRKRLSRARLEIGIRTHRVAVPGEVVMGLVECGFLAANDADDDDAVSIAVAAFLLARAGRHT